MKKRVLFILFLSLMNIAYVHTETNILWEKFFIGDSIEYCQAHSLYCIGNDLILLYGGVFYSQEGSMMRNGYFITDLNGNIIYKKELLDNYRLTHKASFFDGQRFRHYFSHEYGFYRRPFTLFTDESGINLFTSIDTVPERKNSYINLMATEDSIYSASFFPESEELLINIYDKELNYIRDIIPDFSNCNFSVRKTLPTSTLFKNNNFIFAMLCPNTTVSEFEEYYIVCKLDQAGHYQWATKITNENFLKTEIYTLYEAAGGNILAFGQGMNSDSSCGIVLTIIDNDGNIINQNHHVIETNEYLRKATILQYSNKIAVMGSKLNDETNPTQQFCLWLFDSTGSFIEKRIWQYCRSNIIEGISEKENGNMIVYGQNSFDSLYLAEIQPNYLSVDNILVEKSELQVFPTIVKNSCEIKLNNIQALNLEIAIYDIFGNKVKDVSNEPALAQQKSFIVNLSGLAPGSYFVSVNAGGKVIRKKILKI